MDSVDTELTALAAEKLEIARKIDLSPIVARYVSKRGASASRARAIADELRKYLVICAIDGSKGYVINGEIDAMWHTFILFTRRYDDFCRRVAGRFIHHIPSEDMAAFSGDGEAPSYAVTLEAYEGLFGTSPNPDIWPIPDLEKQDPFPCEGGLSPGPSGCVPREPGMPGPPGGPA